MPPVFPIQPGKALYWHPPQTGANPLGFVPVLACFVALGHAAALLPLTHLYEAELLPHILVIHIEGSAEVQ